MIVRLKLVKAEEGLPSSSFYSPCDYNSGTLVMAANHGHWTVTEAELDDVRAELEQHGHALEIKS